MINKKCHIHLYYQVDVGVLYSVVGADSENVSLPGLPVEGLGESQLPGRRIELEVALDSLVDGVPRVILVGEIVVRRTLGDEAVSECANRVRIVGSQNRHYRVRRGFLGHVVTPRTSSPRRCHVVFVQDRYANL